MNNDQPLQPNINPAPSYPNQPISVPATSAQQIPINRQSMRQPQMASRPQTIYQPQSARPMQQPVYRQAAPQYAARPRTLVGPQRPVTSFPNTATPRPLTTAQAKPAEEPKATLPADNSPKISHVDTDSKHPFNNRTNTSTVADPIPEAKKSVSSGPAKPKRHIFRKIFVSLLVLAILGGISYGIFFLKITGDKVVASFFNFTETAAKNASVIIKGTLKITSQNDEPLPIKENDSLLNLVALGDTFSTAKMHFTYSSNVNNLSSQLVLNLSDFGFNEQVTSSSTNLTITNIDENGSYLKYNTAGESAVSIKNIDSKLSSLGLQKDAWVKADSLIDQNYFSVKSLLDLLKAKNITASTYQPDFFVFAFPNNCITKVSNNLYQVVIDTMRLKWFLDKYNLLKIDKPNLFDLPQIYFEIDSTNRVTRILLQGQHNYYNVTINIYDIIFSANPLNIEVPANYVEITPKTPEPTE